MAFLRYCSWFQDCTFFLRDWSGLLAQKGASSNIPELGYVRCDLVNYIYIVHSTCGGKTSMPNYFSAHPVNPSNW